MSTTKNIMRLPSLWLPFTANKLFKTAPRIVTAGKGMYYYDASGRAILDSAAGLWCSNAGISPLPVVQAVQKQVATMSFAPCFQMASQVALDWADAIVEDEHGGLRGRGLDKVFFTLCGSSAVDTSMKIALAYHRMNGEASRTRFVGRERSYHGVGIGGISVGGIPSNRDIFSSMLIPGVDHLPHTYSMDHSNGRGQPKRGGHLADALESIIDLHGAGNIAAVIVEPVAGSAGVLAPPVDYLDRLRRICSKHGVLLIFDEVITGFGRLGMPFASGKFDVTPDICTLAKGLTGGVVPSGAVVVSGHIYDTVVTNSARDMEFHHGYTYSAHPLAAAAGLALLRHYQADGLYERARALMPSFEELLHEFFVRDEFVADVRSIGLMGAVQLRSTVDASAVMRHAWWNEDLYIRISGNTITFSPAFIATQQDLHDMFKRTKRAIHKIAGGGEPNRGVDPRKL